MRRHTMSSLLFSFAQKALLEERAGAAWEQVHCHLTGDGDYSGLAIVDPAKPRSAAADSSAAARIVDTGKARTLAEDDITAADRISNGDRRAADEAERLRKIEAFKQADAERRAAARAAREAGA